MNYLFHVFEKLDVSNRFELLFQLFKECNAQTTYRAGLPARLRAAILSKPLKKVRGGPIDCRLSSSRGYCVEKNGLSAYYWFRVAEANSCELGHRSRALVEELRSTVKTHEIEAVERNVAIAVKNNKLFASKRPADLIKKRSVDSPPLRLAI